jgi:hypothetical protein
MRRLFGYLFLLLLLTSCGGGGGGANSIQNISQPLVSVFVNSPAKGVRFNTSSGLSGVTNENGEFHYRVGDSVEFSLELGGDKIIIGSKTFSSAQPETSVLSLSGNGIDPLAVSQVLQTIDVGTVVGRMDFTGIALPAGTRAIIKEALVSRGAASSRVANIAGSLVSNGYSPKNGVIGVNAAEAISRLSTQTANKKYLIDITSSIEEDNSSLSTITDKSYFQIQEARSGNFVESIYKFGVIFSDGTYRFGEPDDTDSGTYTVSNDGKSGYYVENNSRTGTFRIKIGNASNYFLSYSQDDGLTHGFITGNLLSNLLVEHFFNKTITVTNGCSVGVDAVYVINAVGEWTNSCGSVGKLKSNTNLILGPGKFKGNPNLILNLDVNQYCNTDGGGFVRNIPNTVCLENHTDNTNSLIALSKGTLNSSSGSGTIIRILNKSRNKEFQSWSFTY